MLSGSGFVLLAGEAVSSVVPSLIPYKSEIDFLAQQNMQYCLLVLAAIGITSWTFFGRWLINQLQLQRDANTTMQNKLIEVLTNDHSQSIIALHQVTELTKTTNESLGRLIQKLSDQERVWWDQTTRVKNPNIQSANLQ